MIYVPTFALLLLKYAARAVSVLFIFKFGLLPG